MAMQKSYPLKTVIWHLGGGPIGDETQLPPSLTSSTITARKSPTTQRKQPVYFKQSPVKPMSEDVWQYLTMELQKMNAERPETQFGF